MCTVATRLAIETLVHQRTAEHSLFTAYDITCALRAQAGRRKRIRHAEVREVVHQMYAFGMMGQDYERALLDVGGERGPAYVYHPFLEDPRAYRSRHPQASRSLLPIPRVLSANNGPASALILRIGSSL
ncbi:MAG TPA: hypothetical protein VKT32_12040 [Chthonomonadaceae bacterium]|nr:hypothetical protein [Chthonomonadaceae bacterium]